MIDRRIQLTDDLSFSRFVHGYWRLIDWGYQTQEIDSLLQKGIDLGVTTIDHADIYGDYEVEAVFGQALKNNPGLRNKIELVSKCGIMLKSDKFPDRYVKYYDYSYQHIIKSAENSLKYLQTDYLDVLLLHRPSPIYDPQAVARAFDDLRTSGKVRYFGVSNFSPQQTSTLQSYCEDKLVTNQIEVSVTCLEHFKNENIDYLLQQNMHPMAWSPLTGGKILGPGASERLALIEVLKQVAQRMETDIVGVMYAWLLKHPVGIIPIIGSGKIERIKEAVNTLQLEMSDQDWFLIYQTTLGHEVP